jgi:hypothetical protein
MPRNSHAARIAKKRSRKPGNLAQLVRILWQAVLEAQAVLEGADEDEAELKLRAVHALGQVSGQYAKLLEIDELEARLSALEQAMKGTNETHAGRTTGYLGT